MLPVAEHEMQGRKNISEQHLPQIATKVEVEVQMLEGSKQLDAGRSDSEGH